MKNNKRLKHQQNYKKELQDYETSINDTQILHLRNMLCDIYDCTGWCATTLKEYINVVLDGSIGDQGVYIS